MNCRGDIDAIVLSDLIAWATSLGIVLLPAGPAQPQSQMNCFCFIIERCWACLILWSGGPMMVSLDASSLDVPRSDDLSLPGPGSMTESVTWMALCFDSMTLWLNPVDFCCSSLGAFQSLNMVSFSTIDISSTMGSVKLYSTWNLYRLVCLSVCLSVSFSLSLFFLWTLHKRSNHFFSAKMSQNSILKYWICYIQNPKSPNEF